MIIQCSQCEARYVVPDTAIGAAGRNVRCAKCRHSWFVAAPPAAALEPETFAPETAATPKPIPPGSNLPAIKYASAPAGIKAGTFGWLAAAAALLALLCWPQIYGYPRSRGLALAEVNMLSRYDDKHPEEKKPIYEITGKIVNTTEATLSVPVLRITLLDKEGAKLQYWDFSEKDRTLEGGKNIPFSTGPLDIKFKQPARFLVELGNALELSLRRHPG